MELFPVTGKPLDLHGKTIVLPAVTIGNVGQLAADLLINTFSLPCKGVLQDPTLLPCVGLGAYDAEAAGTLSTEMQLYGDSASSWVVVQQRSPPAPGRQQAFAESVSDFLVRAGACQVLVLASADAALRHDDQLASRAVRFRALSEGAAESARELGFQEMEDERSSAQSSPPAVLPPWPLWREFEQRSVPALLLIWHASEGDNTGDALVLATAAAQALDKLHGEGAAGSLGGNGGGERPDRAGGQRAWKAPRSWGAALYGSQRVIY